MRVLILSAGLGSVQRGYERFLLDLVAQLRSNGLSVTCWGSAEREGVRSLPGIGREELQQMAHGRLGRDVRLASFPIWELYDWSLHAEEHLFAISAAAHLDEELGQDEPTVVYVKWLGGLVDAGGRSTILLEKLARAAKERAVSLICHTDWVYWPVLSRLASAGFVFHSTTPWISRKLLDAGFPPARLFELSCGTIAAPFRNLGSRRPGQREAFGIPSDAFVILTVGAFHHEVKNFPYLARELAPLARHDDCYWVVAGSRGVEPLAWEREAQRSFGPRFISLVDVPFEKMPDVYSLADLALCGSLNETFGLCYLEAQLAGLPCLMHDYAVTEWLAQDLPAELTPISRVNMRAVGAVSGAVAEWRKMLSSAGQRKSLAEALEHFRLAQEQRFAWENLGPRYAEAFRRYASPCPGKQSPSAPVAPATARGQAPKSSPRSSAGSAAALPAEVLQPASSNCPLNILVVHESLPQTDRGGSEVRLMQVLRELREQGHSVTFIARVGNQQARYGPALERLGIRIYGYDAERTGFLGLDCTPRWSLGEVLRETRFDLAILCQWFWTGITVPEHYLDAIRRHSPQTRIAVLTDDRHGVRELRLAELTGAFLDRERGRDFQERETEIYRLADLVLAITEEDRAGLLDVTPDLQTHILPMTVEKSPRGPGFAARQHILFLGSFSNLANCDAVEWFLDRVWPKVHLRLPAVEFHLAGNQMPEALRARSNGVLGLGHIPDVGPAFAAHRVFVSPIRYGTGIKTKNLAALSRGLPVVTTAIGAEGMGLRDGRHALIADDEESFASAVVRLYGDRKLWQRLSRDGRTHILAEFSRDKLRWQVARLIDRARSIAPRSLDAQYLPSYRRVERVHPEVLSHQPAKDRPGVRLVGYVRFGEQLFEQGQPARALSQFRHALHHVRTIAPVAIFRRLICGLERCYRALGDLDSANRCREEAAHCSPATAGGATGASGCAKEAQEPPQNKREPQGAQVFSVIVPTFNRCSTLRRCLDALNSQTFPGRDFEVIVADDGSTDETAQLCGNFASRFRLKYVHLANQGAGAARRAGVAEAAGDLLLLINDDTIAAPQLLAEHARVHREHGDEKLAVLGDFRYPPESRRRALTHFISTNPFMFHQAGTEPASRNGYEYFITCNLSVSRKAVMEVGSFDARFRVAEDSDLGARLEQQGYRVLYHPAAAALHDHLNIKIHDVVRRARLYGKADWLLLHKHPHLLLDGATPFGRMDGVARAEMAKFVARSGGAVKDAVRALERFDDLDFSQYFDLTSGSGTAARDVMKLFGQAVPIVHWFHLYQSFLEIWHESDEAQCDAALTSSAEVALVREAAQ